MKLALLENDTTGERACVKVRNDDALLGYGEGWTVIAQPKREPKDNEIWKDGAWVVDEELVRKASQPKSLEARLARLERIIAAAGLTE